MLRSLYAGVSGMRNNQTKMDVIGNNIANVNTTGFKSGRVRFQDMLSQTIANAQSPTANSLGGVNPQQIGLGVKVGAIDTIMTGGALQPTNRDLDFAIEGNGFFVVSQDTNAEMKYYTRDGAFYRDYQGNLVNASGYRVLGYMPAAGDPYASPEMSNLDIDEASMKPLSIPNTITVGVNDLSLETFSIDGSGQIIGVYSDGNPYLLGQLAVSKFNNSEGLEKAGNNNYTASNNSGQPETGVANGDGFGTIRQGVIEMSNVDLANEFTEMIITSRSYQANSRTITTSDEMLQELINLKR
ncbi:flagellar hook-basal body complex protein [Alkalibacter mobilis]|uniref:flagellar hook-basal body complex protein n=1 Tax=Alkalibacter mobilis TaxID=2787712 RepID=UPI00189E6B05|nr:flagellar hook-basal body complex protein [Alkalibacter mobilis]MBF7096316.1 flagellar hook-basal body complex protein [Alkalibacter mobilis]